MLKIALEFRDGLDEIYIRKQLEGHLEFAEVIVDPDYVISFGGDGTFLDAVNRFGMKPIYIPINMGTLGFYSSWGKNGIEHMVRDLKDKCVIEAPTLEITVYHDDEKRQYRCLNEMTLINPINTQILDVFINGYEIEKFRGTGICVSTPTGSTAYNKSLGGAIFSPTKRLFQLTHIAAINNIHYRSIGNSIVLDDSEVLEFKSDQLNYTHTTMMVDRQSFDLANVSTVRVRMSEDTVKILVPRDNNFYRRVKKSFIE